MNILDIGTGTGIIPLLIADNKNIENITAVEVQDEIANMAQRSIEYNNLSDKIKILNLDLKEYSTSEKFDLILTNPPYMKLEGGNISENLYKAISRHELKLNLDDLLKKSYDLLKTGGSFNIIYRSNRFLELISKLEKNNFYPKRLRFVYTKPGKDSNLFMIEAIKNKKTFLDVSEPIYIFDENGEYTEEVLLYY